MVWTRYCGTAAKAGGNGEDERRPVVMGVAAHVERQPGRDGGSGRTLLSLNPGGLHESPQGVGAPEERRADARGEVGLSHSSDEAG